MTEKEKSVFLEAWDILDSLDIDVIYPERDWALCNHTDLSAEELASAAMAGYPVNE